MKLIDSCICNHEFKKIMTVNCRLSKKKYESLNGHRIIVYTCLYACEKCGFEILAEQEDIWPKR